MSYDGPWRNRIYHLYTQYCNLDQCPQKLLKILEKHGSAFDDNWYYKICGKTMKVVTRRPLWLDRGEGGWLAEKPKIKGEGHLK